MSFNLKFLLVVIFLTSIPHTSYAFDRDLNIFKKTIERSLNDYEKEITKLKKSKLLEGDKIDEAAKEFLDLLKFSSETLNEEDIYTAIESIDFLTKNIDSALKIIPPETITTLENVDFKKFSEEQTTMLSEIMTGMNRKKMDDFKEIVTKMVVLENEGFEAENFMNNLQDLDMGLALLNDENMDLEFELTGLSNKTLEDVAKDLDTFDKELQNIQLEKVTSEINNLSDSISTSTPNVSEGFKEVSSSISNNLDNSKIINSTEQVASTVAETNVAEVTEEVASTVAESNVAEVTEEVASTVAESNIAEVTEEVATTVAESNIAEVTEEVATTVAESNIAEVTEVAETVAESSIQDFVETAENIQDIVEEVADTVVEETVEVIEEVQENVKRTNSYSDRAEQLLRDWVNPNATCWIRDDGYSVECDY